MATIISYNVNGIRAALKKGWAEWAKATNADVIGLQEIKAQTDQLDLSIFEDLGYHHYWFSAQKKGYSGVALLCKEKPLHVEYGCGIEKYDFENVKFINGENLIYLLLLSLKNSLNLDATVKFFLS